MAYLDTLDPENSLNDSIKKYHDMDKEALNDLVKVTPYYEFYNLKGLISNENYGYTFTKDAIIRSIDGNNDIFGYSYLNIDINDLIKAFLEMQERNEYKKPRTTKITRREISVSEKTNYIRDIFKTKDKLEFNELFSEYSKEELVVTLLCVLEMSKNKEITIYQEKNFSTITLEKLHE